jgi:MFS family permease
VFYFAERECCLSEAGAQQSLTQRNGSSPFFPTFVRSNPVATIALAQLFGTSLWFSANSAADDLRRAWGASVADIGLLTSAVQLGFILGTLAFAMSGLADRFAASKIFATCSVMGALFNACFGWFSHGLTSAAILRFMVGICLAGIYPIGMKLIVSWVPERTGSALGYLVGMLTLGTALPHGLRLVGARWPWQQVIASSSGLALLAAFIVFALGDGPHLRKKAATKQLSAVLVAFRSDAFRAAAFGYFGHMWELYTFWTLVPLLVMQTASHLSLSEASVSGRSFAIIGIGALGCIVGGVLSRRVGSARVAAVSLATSGLCCLIFAAGWQKLSATGMVVLLLVWGVSVVADSPQFSALSAKTCPPELVGSALAVQNSAGFAITIVSIAITTSLFVRLGVAVVWMLLPGPLLGLAGLYPLLRKSGPHEAQPSNI